MNLRELINDAIHQINIYKHPNIDEAQKALSKILDAAGLGSIEHDQIENLSIINDDTLFIETSWSTRGCAQTGSYQLPLNIIDVENPVKAAKIWGLNRQINENQSELSSLNSRIKWYLNSELQTLEQS